MPCLLLITQISHVHCARLNSINWSLSLVQNGESSIVFWRGNESQVRGEHRRVIQKNPVSSERDKTSCFSSTDSTTFCTAAALVQTQKLSFVQHRSTASRTGLLNDDKRQGRTSGVLDENRAMVEKWGGSFILENRNKIEISISLNTAFNV